MRNLSSFKRHHLNRTIRALYPLIDNRVRARSIRRWREYDLRKELIGCILGSQVRHEMAVATMRNMESSGLLNNAHWKNNKDNYFESHVLGVLSGRNNSLIHKGAYRFPIVRSKQLIEVRNALVQSSLTARLAEDISTKHLRKNLVSDIPGLGPKQASMFLRNIGRSYNLAILDTHVLSFMDIQKLISKKQVYIGTINGYEKIESIVIDYANSLGYLVGYLDWAIWATMKAAREIEL